MTTFALAWVSNEKLRPLLQWTIQQHLRKPTSNRIANSANRPWKKVVQEIWRHSKSRRGNSLCNKVCQNEHECLPCAKVFGEESDSSEEAEPSAKGKGNIPRNAKFSKNIGRKTVTGGKPARFTMTTRSGVPVNRPEWGINFCSRLHPRHRPTLKYFDDKLEKQKL